MRRTVYGLSAVIVVVSTSLAWAWPAAAAPDPPITTCAGTTVGTTFTLTANCDTTSTLTVPDGFTVNGAGHTITAHDPTTGGFSGPVVTNAAGSTAMTITDLTIQGTGFAVDCAVGSLYGILFNDASGSVSNVHVAGITQHSGCGYGSAIRANALAGTARTVTITGAVLTVNVSGSTVGPPDTLPPAGGSQNGVQYGVGGAGGTFTGNTVYGSGYGSAADDSTAILAFAAANLTISGNTLTGAGTDVGIAVDNSTGITIENNNIGRTGPDTPDSYGFGVSVDAGSAPTTSLVCNTFSGWVSDTNGITQPPCITTTSVKDGTVGRAYADQLAATLTSPPGTWTVTSGALPPSLHLAADGAITGTPTAAGRFTFTAEVTDANGAKSARTFTIVIAGAAPAPSPSPTVPATAPSRAASNGTGLAPTGPDRRAWPVLVAGMALLGCGSVLLAMTRRRTVPRAASSVDRR
jgi:hypothetical protein